ncbi:FAD-dependent oxidoreductase [Streptomyces prunicolor]|uniref:FAD-dependent oxidoreductase n=1 Tax=Streptomyces prunicolor TaxID=67348 RepID=UPI00224C9F96|nr:FAD-dependent oxidoreductase [Streptomyces prunicolor]
MNLDAVGVKTGTRGEIVIDEFQRTTNGRIWAAGDVAGGPQFVYVAAAQVTLAADNALAGVGRTLDYTALPRVIFTSPAIAAVGLTDAQVTEAGMRCDCRTLPLEYVPRVLANRDTRGRVKLVTDADTGRVLGVHVITDSAGMTVDQLARAWART